MNSASSRNEEGYTTCISLGAKEYIKGSKGEDLSIIMSDSAMHPVHLFLKSKTYLCMLDWSLCLLNM